MVYILVTGLDKSLPAIMPILPSDAEKAILDPNTEGLHANDSINSEGSVTCRMLVSTSFALFSICNE